MTDLMRAARAWWFGNVPGPFPLNHGFVSRGACYRHGGPSRLLDACEECQESEWLSRACGEPLYVPHGCAKGTADLCHRRCLAQGDEGWCNLWQDFSFARGVGDDALAPHLVVLTTDRGERWLRTQNCDVSNRVFQRLLARACLYDVVGQAPGGADEAKVDWGRYDAALVINAGVAYRTNTRVVPLPILMYGHDCYRQVESRQAVVERYQPGWFWAPNVHNWRARVRFPEGTVLARRVDAPTTFWTRPTLGPEGKACDFMVVGATQPEGDYSPRWALARWAERVEGVSVRFSTGSGGGLADWEGPVGGTTTALLAWSRLLGSARFTMFGETIHKPGWVMRKDWEVMASGAVPVVPDTPDKAELGILPWVHFVPLADVQGRDEALRGLAREHGALSLIAERAVAHSRGTMDELALGGFEELLLGALEGRYRGRVLE